MENGKSEPAKCQVTRTPSQRKREKKNTTPAKVAQDVGTMTKRQPLFLPSVKVFPNPFRDSKPSPQSSNP